MTNRRIFKAGEWTFEYNEDYSGDVRVRFKYIDDWMNIPYAALMKFMIHAPSECKPMEDENERNTNNI